MNIHDATEQAYKNGYAQGLKDAVPITELLELRDKLYETDKITMKGLKMLNELIAMHDRGRKENG